MVEPTQTVKHLVITGRVQGVGFRNFVHRSADELHVSGWVRNRHDGSVEAMLAGTSATVDAMIERARRGPRNAVVAEVTVTAGDGSFERFDTLPSA